MTGSSKVSKYDFPGQFLNVKNDLNLSKNDFHIRYEFCRMFVGFAIFANVDFRDTLFSKTRARIFQPFNSK